ncbi:porin [Vibrio hannami]|uniref:porin n=1 Tax=Vibrio hannami TaxID=2717094 RepID=UPI00240F5912|nr:outer membrane beta-barrel protein [Vibrio hannami]MDG3088175.1 porin [Vibrio hannami]
MKKTLLALALTGVATTASADSLVYGGVMFGQSDMGDESSTATSLHVGTGILPIIGIEAGYTDHGSFDTPLVGDTDVTSTFLAVRPSIDLGPLHIYARGGVHKWDFENSAVKDDGTDIMYGVGAEYFLFGPLAVGAGYNVYQLKDREDIKQFSISATIHFL